MFVWRKSAVDISVALCFFTLFFLVLFTKLSFLVCFLALLLSLFSHERKKDYFFFFIVSAWMANDNVIKGLTSDPILCLYFWQIFCGCTYMPSISECGRIGKWNEIKPKRNHETREKECKIHTAQFAFISSSHIFHIPYPTVLWIVSCGVFPKKKWLLSVYLIFFSGEKNISKEIVIIE